MPQWSSNDHERAMYSNTVPWPMHFRQWPHSTKNSVISQSVYTIHRLENCSIESILDTTLEARVQSLAQGSINSDKNFALTMLQSDCTMLITVKPAPCHRYVNAIRISNAENVRPMMMTFNR